MALMLKHLVGGFMFCKRAYAAKCDVIMQATDGVLTLSGAILQHAIYT